MTAQITEPMPLSQVVANNMKAEAARAGLTQGRLALALGMSREAVSARSRGVTPWTVDEVERAANLFGLRPAELLVRQQGLEPRTR